MCATSSSPRTQSRTRSRTPARAGPATASPPTRHGRDFQLAEDAVQDAFAAAAASWPRDGLPASPGGWIAVAARRRAIDRLRRNRSLQDRAERLAALVSLDSGDTVIDTDI